MQKLNASSTLPGDFLAPLDSVGTITLNGEETAKYLQGQVTVDIDKLSPEHSLLGCHCDFKGKTWSIFYAAGDQHHATLVTHKGAMAGSLAELNKYGVFSKVEISDGSDQCQIFGGCGVQLENFIQSVFGDLPKKHLETTHSASGFVIALTRPIKRYLLVLTNAQAQSLLDDYQGELFDEQIWELLDIQGGMANIQGQTSNEFVPQMMNLQVLDAISFDKGCYMGQEVVARTKYLGKNKRAAFILKSNQRGDLVAGDLLEMQVGDNWRRGGTVLRSANLGEESWLLAVLANDTETGAVLRSKEKPQQVYNVLPLPYEIDQS